MDKLFKNEEFFCKKKRNYVSPEMAMIDVKNVMLLSNTYDSDQDGDTEFYDPFN